MLDNALRIILFLYIVSGCMAAGDVLIAAPMGIQLQTLTGEPAGPQLSHIMQRMEDNDMAARLAEAAGEVDVGTQMERAIVSIELGLDMAVEMFKMLAGLYAFDILTIFGVPHEITAIIVSVYVILVGRALLGYMPAISSGVRALTDAGRTVGSAISTGVRFFRP